MNFKIEDHKKYMYTCTYIGSEDSSEMQVYGVHLNANGKNTDIVEITTYKKIA